LPFKNSYVNITLLAKKINEKFESAMRVVQGGNVQHKWVED
jgi:hypothetical protein